MNNLSAVANEVFQILRSFDYTVMMYDDDGMTVDEPDEARRLFAKQENLLVSINDDNDNSSVNLYLSGNTDAESVLGLIDSLRTTSNKYNMIFNNKQWDSELSVKDFSTKHAVRENREPMTDLTEGMFGTSRSSYLKLENARMIVRHSAKIDENIVGARSRRVESIFCENAQGERFLFPTKQLAPARAMTQHFNHGGSFADEVGQQITQMASDYSALGNASTYIGMNQAMMAEGAGDVRQKCRDSRKGMRKCFERLFRESSYASQAESLREASQVPTLVEDAAIERIREMLTIEGKELSEDIINAVARCIESAPVLDEAVEEVNVEDEQPKHDPRETTPTEKGDTISILGKEVNAAAWEQFKSGSLPIRVSPESIQGSQPSFASRTAEIGFKLSNLAPLVISDSIGNLLSWAAEELPGAESHPKLYRQLILLASKALEAADVKVTEGLGFRGSSVIREFEDWYDSMGADRVLSGGAAPVGPEGAVDAPMDPMGDTGAVDTAMPPMDAPLGDTMADAMADAMPMPMEVGEVISDTGSDESMAADLAQGYTEGAGWTLDFAEAQAAAGACGGVDAVNTQIALAVLGGARNGSVHSDPAMGPRRSFAWAINDTVAQVAPPVAEVPPVMTPSVPMDTVAAPVPAAVPGEQDFALGGDDFAPDMMEGELTREDILLPKDQNADLKQEVGHEMNDEDESELTMERLRKLSGIKIS